MEGFRAGYAAELITPKKHYDLSGYVARENPALGVHDPVEVTGLYLAESQEVLIVSIGVLGFTPEEAARLRLALAQQCKLPVDHIMLAATHTHSAPATMRLSGCGQPDAAWWSELQPVVERVAVQAKAAAQPARIGVGTTRVPGIARNRRDPKGPLDDTLTVVKVEFPEEKQSVAVVNYACHPVVLPAENRLVSGDYPGAVTRYMRGRGVDALFMTGACGDINPLTHGDFELVAEIGKRLGRAALDLLPTIETRQGAVLVASRSVMVRWSAPTAEQLARDPGAWGAILHRPDPNRSDIQRIVQTWNAWIDRHQLQTPPWPTEIEVEVQVIEAGPALFVALPGEVFCQTGLLIKEHLGPATVIAGYTNGNIGYLPTLDAYPHGRYEVAQAHVYYGYPGVVMEGTAEYMAQVAVGLTQRLSRQRSLNDI